MAEIQTHSDRSPGGNTRAKKQSTRIDFTPMVDLGFLLITFFMLATALAKPSVMKVVMPAKQPDPSTSPAIPESKTLTLLLGKNDKVYWCEGITQPVLDSTDFTSGGLRRLILAKMEAVEKKWGLEMYERMDKVTGLKASLKGSYLTVLIKPSASSRYKNLVDVLDEMAITGVRHYAILDISSAEERFIKYPKDGLIRVC